MPVKAFNMAFRISRSFCRREDMCMAGCRWSRKCTVSDDLHVVGFRGAGIIGGDFSKSSSVKHAMSTGG
jgi:hypothetical protein